MSEKVIVIGGGPAGLSAAIAASRAGDAVVLLEHTERVGKKILMTGNGKCNYTNLKLDASCYHAPEDGFVMQAIRAFGPEDTVAFFKGLGIEPLERHGGYLYPHSEQAASVLNALRAECERTGVRIVTACTVKAIRRNKGRGFRVMTDLELFQADRVILATGSKAYPNTGSDGSGFALSEAFGHRTVKVLPALCGLCCAEKEFFRTAQGVRVTGRVTVKLEDTPAASAEGEIQIAPYGFSGIPVFQVSRYASRALSVGRHTSLEIDFLPDFPDTKAYLSARAAGYPYGNLEAFGNGLMNKNLWNSILKRAALKPGASPAGLSDGEMEVLASELRSASFRVIRTNGYDQSQTCTGGVSLEEIFPANMESKLVPGLHFAGEMMDVDGICGGYNLQWAFTSGILAGRNGREASGRL